MEKQSMFMDPKAHSKDVNSLQFIYRFNIIPIKSLCKNFYKEKQEYSKIYMERQKNKIVLKKKESHGINPSIQFEVLK